MELSCRGQGLPAQRAEGVSYQKTPHNPSKTGRDRVEARPVSPPPVQGEDPETSLCGMRGGEEEICKDQYPNSAKSSPEKPEGEKRRIRKPNDEEMIGIPIQEGNRAPLETVSCLLGLLTW